MKKTVCIAVVVLLLLGIVGCVQNIPVTKPELQKTTEDVEISILPDRVNIWSWENAYTFNNTDFEELQSGCKIEFEFSQLEDTTYTRVILKNSDWKSYLFSNLICNPDPYYTQQNDEDGNLRSKIAVSDYDSSNVITYKVTIIPNEDEINMLKEKGLLFEGSNYYLKSFTIYGKKDFYGKDLSFEEQYELFAQYRNSVINNYSKKFKTPMIFITTEGRQDIKKKEYYNSMIDVVNCDEEYILSELGEVKVRGNSTADDRWSPNQKPLRIKFANKKNMLGLHGGKKYKSWVLLKAENFTPMDYLGFNLAHEIYKTSEYDYYASDCKFVHVFINDEYNGQFLLCEQNQVNSGRVDVDENKAGSLTTKTGYMIELDNYCWDDLKDGYGRWFGDGCSQGKEDYHFSLTYKSDDEEKNGVYNYPWGGSTTGVKLKDVNGEERVCIDDDFTLKSDVYSDSQVSFIKKYTKNLWTLCFEAIENSVFLEFDENYDLIPSTQYSNSKDVCAAAIDLESLCNEMILEELVRDNDVGAGSLYMAIDFTKPIGQKYNKFTFECPWDFNWGYSYITNDRDGGAYWNGKLQYFAGAWQSLYILDDEYDRSHPWFVLFNNAPWFRQMLREKWNRIGKNNLTKVLDNTDKATVAACRDLGGGDGRWITDFVRNRINYIDNYLWK